MTEQYAKAMCEALGAAGYPEPGRLDEPGRVTMYWGNENDRPEITVSDDGGVVVFAKPCSRCCVRSRA